MNEAAHHRPLAGRRVLVTRTREQASALRAQLETLGADVLEVPTIRIAPPESYDGLDRALANLERYNILIVTSANTARVLRERGIGAIPPALQVMAVGPATAEALRETGVRVDRVPVPAVGESVVRELAPHAAGKRILLARAAVARDVIPLGLRAAGATVEIAEAYRTVLANESRAILETAFAPDEPPVDAVTFTSSSTVQHFFALLGEEAAGRALERVAVCSIGPVTSGTLREFGVEPAIEAAEHTVGGLVVAIVVALSSTI